VPLPHRPAARWSASWACGSRRCGRAQRIRVTAVSGCSP